MARYITLVSIAWDTATEYYSFQGVSLPTQHYDARLISISPIVREVPYPAGDYRISGGTITLDNTDNHFGTLKSTYSFRNRIATISIVDADTDATLYTLWTASIVSWQIAGYKISFDLRDDTMSRLMGKIPGLIFNDTNFPNIPADSERSLVPWVYGRCSADGASQKGLIPLRLVTEANPFTYIIAYNRISAVSRVYVYGVLKTGGGADYTITTAAIGSITYDVVTFTTDQRDAERPTESEVTADVDGYDNSTFQDSPIAQIIYLMVFGGFETVVTFPLTVATLAASTKCTDRNMTGNIWIGDSDTTGLDILNRYAESFNWSPYRTKSGMLSVYQYAITDEIDATSSATLSDENDVIADSLQVYSYDEPISRLQANYLFNWIPEKQYFEYQPRPNDEMAEDEIVRPTSENLNLYCVHDSLTAEFIRRERRYLMSEGVYFAEMDLPFENYDLELNEWITLTADQGIGATGFAAKKMRIIALVLHLNPVEMRVTARCVATPPVMPSDIAGDLLFCDAKRLPVVADTTALATWPDESEIDNDMTQATGANQPAYRTLSGPDSGACVQFDGNDYLAKTGGPITDASDGIAVFAVFRCTAAGTQTILSQSQAGAIKIALYASGTTLRFTVDGNSTYATYTIAADTWYIVSGIHDDTAGADKTRLYVNGTVGIVTANAAHAALSVNDVLTVGALDDGTNPMTGYVAHASVVARPTVAIMDAERRTIEAMLSERYGITVY